MPEPLRLEAERSEGRGWTVEPAWRKWRVDNWNAAYEPDRIDWTRPGREQLSLRFETPWSPPLAAIRTGALRLGFTFRLTFCTGESVGWATIDEERYLNYSHDAPPAEQGLPQELIDDFDLLAIYQSAKAGEI